MCTEDSVHIIMCMSVLLVPKMNQNIAQLYCTIPLTVQVAQSLPACFVMSLLPNSI